MNEWQILAIIMLPLTLWTFIWSCVEIKKHNKRLKEIKTDMDEGVRFWKEKVEPLRDEDGKIFYKQEKDNN